MCVARKVPVFHYLNLHGGGLQTIASEEELHGP